MKTDTLAGSSKAPPIDIGIKDEDRKALAEGLSKVLADTFSLYLKTHNFHWNVTGPMFQTLHLMFETHYNELWLATDLLAERIRSLGHSVHASYTDFSKLTVIKESQVAPEATEMVRQLVEGHEAVARVARAVLVQGESARDASTVDMLTQRLQVHEKTAWMLRALLE